MDNESISNEAVIGIMANGDGDGDGDGDGGGGGGGENENEQGEPDWRIAVSGPPPKNWYVKPLEI